jgi:hypothetical protein
VHPGQTSARRPRSALLAPSGLHVCARRRCAHPAVCGNRTHSCRLVTVPLCRYDRLSATIVTYLSVDNESTDVRRDFLKRA